MSKKVEKHISQREQIQKHLIRYGSITSKKAAEKYGISRLSSIIFRLRKHYYIETIKIKDTYKYILKGVKKGK